MSKFAYTTYQKVLLDLRTALRGGSFDKNDFLKELNILDDSIIDFVRGINLYSIPKMSNNCLRIKLTLIMRFRPILTSGEFWLINLNILKIFSLL